MKDTEQPSNRRGRPKARQPLEAQVSARFLASEYERLVKAANQREDKSVSALVRQLVNLRLP